MGSKNEASDQQIAIRWAVRTVVFGVLLILLVLAFLDFRAKGNALQTANRWRERLEESYDQQGLAQKDLAEMTMGNPRMRDGELSELHHPMRSLKVKVYEWWGPFRNYSVRVGLVQYGQMSLGDSEVEVVEGPGEPIVD